jgi:hypothetical protein
MHTVSKESDTLMHSMKQSVLDLKRWAYLQQVAVLGWLSQTQVHYISTQPHSRCSHSSMKHVIHFYWVMWHIYFVPRDISDHVPTLSDCLAELHAKRWVHLTCKLQNPGLCSLEICICQTKQIGSFMLSLTLDVHARTELLHTYIFNIFKETHRYFLFRIYSKNTWTFWMCCVLLLISNKMIDWL